MNFAFHSPTQFIFGPGKRAQAAEIAKRFGGSVLLVTGSNPSRHSEFSKSLEVAGLKVRLCQVAEEPTAEFCQEAANACKANNTHMVVSIGGGAVIDAGKAIAALATNQGEVFDYLEIIGKGKPLQEASLPFLPLPTTSGTGSEATRNAVLTSKKNRLKVSLRSEKMFPTVAIVDPELTFGLSPELTAATGMDALTQLVESFTSCKSNPMTEALCREGIPRVARSIEVAVHHGNDLEARSNMSLGSLFSGIALANSGLGAVHGFADPMGGMFGVAHGQICAALLPAVFRTNYLEAERVDSIYVKRFAEVAVLLTGQSTSSAEDAIEWLDQLSLRLNLKRLRDLGIPEVELKSVIQPARNSNSMKGNPVTLSDSQLEEILQAAW